MFGTKEVFPINAKVCVYQVVHRVTAVTYAGDASVSKFFGARTQ